MWDIVWQWFSEPGNQKICLAILIALFLGFIIGRLVWSRREGSRELFNLQGDKSFFKGIQYILSNSHDQAIEEFTKFVQVNSDTIETYIALGNLYRSKGEIDRAIRIRQTIILRPNIEDHVKIRALIDLGLDYRKGGFLNRALETFQKVISKEPSNLETLREIEKIYQEMRDWGNAFATYKKISQLVPGKHSHILAHYQTELGKTYEKEGNIAGAKSVYKLAISLDKNCVDAYLHLGDLYFNMQEYRNAIETWRKVVRVAPRLTFLAYNRLEGAYSKMENLKPVEEFLKECTKLYSDPFTHMALSRYLFNEKDYDGALRELKEALKADPRFWEARKFMGEILLALQMKEDALGAYEDLIPHLDVPYLKFQCTNCGFKPPELQWQCPQCKQWDTIDFMESVQVDSPIGHPRKKLLSEISAPGSEDDQ